MTFRRHCFVGYHGRSEPWSQIRRSSDTRTVKIKPPRATHHSELASIAAYNALHRHTDSRRQGFNTMIRIYILTMALFLSWLPENAALAGSSKPTQFNALEYFDRALVSELGIESVTVSISRHGPDSGLSIRETSACLVDEYNFDRAGNLVLWSPPLVGSDFGFIYNMHGELEDWSRISSNGEILLFRDHYASQGFDPEKEMAQIRSFLNIYVADRINTLEGHFRSVVSICFNIDAAYIVQLEFNEDSSPRYATATRERELDSGVFGPSSTTKSPPTLHIYFKYRYRSERPDE